MDCLNTHQSKSLARFVKQQDLNIDLGIKGKSSLLKSVFKTLYEIRQR
ncbi:MAG: hypothetical protein SAL70_08245 [Scytonema sp. PMC 1070.18]|nr:hypothetical protein [Scytonema sp. PMC 1070.18]